MNIILKDDSDLTKPPKRAKKPRKPINRISRKQAQYERWLETDARPAVIERDGNYCRCCKRPPYSSEKLDLNHVKGKGAHPGLKRDIANLELLCRYPCHRNYTDRKLCLH